MLYSLSKEASSIRVLALLAVKTLHIGWRRNSVYFAISPDVSAKTPYWMHEEFCLLCYIPQCYCLRRLYIRICSVLRSDLVAISMYACMYLTRFLDVQRLHIGCRRKTDHYCIVQQSLGGDVRRLRIGWSRNSVSLGNFPMRKPQLASCHPCHHRHLQHHRHQYYM